ncbi:MAG: maltose alpha-D-glucosyltransferase [Candidatus Rokuibacteriota bacterium]|nr:MAG: maltose alpha-D-glucosyltransferase [Candidatus Rokubacteria bacterium]
MSTAEADFQLHDDPSWYKDAIIYELHVRGFHDANGDGIGDFRGLTQRLDYLQDLGVTAIWLLPFCPSPLRDDGYDIADYTAVHSAYGSVRDFRMFLREAHQRGLRVITELVLNHTSDEHAWFQRARRAKPGSRWRDFYVWSDTAKRYGEARIIFRDFELSNWTWDPVANAYYWHRFYAHQPDLNYDSPHVRQAVLRVLDFWLGLGVDGLRLDAVPYLHEREGTSCENLPETHAFLKELRCYVDRKYKNRLLLAEANQWPDDAIAYFGDGDECHMAFHFPLMPRLFMAIRREDRFPIIDIVQQTPSIPDTCQWALFLRNHDELTLEMVTDEDRDYMYRLFALDPQARINLGIRRRLAPLLGNDRDKIRLMNSLLFSLPGTPVIYYGDEIGMGDNFYLGDRNGVRTPMQWSADRNAGFSRANPQRLYLPVVIDPEYRYEAVNVEAQQSNPHSLLWWMKRLISFRKRYSAVLGRGRLELLHTENRKVLAFIRVHESQRLLVVANLSRFAQPVELDLSAFKGMVPLELFGQSRFLPVGEGLYALTLGPHSSYWLALEPEHIESPVAAAESAVEPATLTVTGAWQNALQGREKAALEAVLPPYLMVRRWFGGKARTIQSVEVVETVPVPHDAPVGYITVIEVVYAEGEPETYVLPLTFAPGARAADVQDPRAVVARLRVLGKDQEQEGVLHDALLDRAFASALLEVIARGRHFAGPFGELIAVPSPDFRPLLSSAGDFLEPSVLRAEQSNTSVVYGDVFIMKLFRRLQPGVNPDLGIGRLLTERNFPNIAPVAGALEYRPKNGGLATLAILQSFLPNEGDAWRYTLDTLGRYFEEVLARRGDAPTPSLPSKPLPLLVEEDFPSQAREWVGLYVEEARLLGERTGQLHVALARETDDPDFAPEPLSDFHRQAVYQGMLSLTNQTLPLLRRRLASLPNGAQGEAQRVLDLEERLHRRFRLLRDSKISGLRIRVHGDYHLGQVLYTGKDFVIIDFEGEPARPLSVRQLKRSPVHDVAGMLRSFHYAAHAALLGQVAGTRPEDFPSLEPWARLWYLGASSSFLKAYLEVVNQTPLLPPSTQELQVLLDAYVLEKALYELGYELNNRPDWVRVPLLGILELLGEER